MRTTIAPLALPRFRRLIGAYGVNATGDWLGEIALSVLLLHSGGGIVAVGALWVLGRFVPALVAPAASAWLSRRGPARLVSWLHAGESLLFGVLAVAAAAGAPAPALLALATADGVLAIAARGLIKAAIVTETRPAGLHREGNALVSGAFTVTAAAGPALAGVLVATVGVPATLALNAASFAIAAVLLRPFAGTAPDAEGHSPLAPLRHGLAHLREHRMLRRLLAMDAATCVFFAMIIPVEIVFVTQTLGGTEADYGAVLTAWGVGAMAASAALPALRRAPLLALVGAGLALMVASYAGMGAAGGVDAVLAWSLIGGVGNGLEGMALVTLVQQRTPDRLQAPVNTLMESLHTAAPGAGYALGAVLAALASPRAVYAVAAIGALAAIGAALPLRLPSRRRGARSADGLAWTACAPSSTTRGASRA